MNKSLSKNAVLSSVRVFANIVFPLITYPYITRVLSVDGIGRVDFSNSIVSYFSLLGALGIGTFATRTGAKIRDNKEALEIFSGQVFTINCISCGISFLLLLLLLCFPTRLESYKWLIFLNGISLIFSPMGVDWLYNIEEDFAYITVRSIIIQFISMIMLFVFVHSYNDLYVYVGIRVFSNSFANVINLIYSRKYLRIRLVRDTKWKEYHKSILVFLGNTVTQTIYLNSDVTFLGLLTNDYYVGIYGVATKIYYIVKQVFNAAISVAIPRLSYYANENEAQFMSLLRRIIHFTMVLVIPAIVGLILFNDEIVHLISGNGFSEAATTLVILAVTLAFAILANILNNSILIPMGKESRVLQGAVLSASINFILNLFFIPLFKQNGAAFTTLLAELTMVLNAAYCIKLDIKKLICFKDIFHTMIGCMVMTGVYGILSYFGLAHGGLCFLLSMVICGLSYIICMLNFKDSEILFLLRKIHMIKLN